MTLRRLIRTEQSYTILLKHSGFNNLLYEKSSDNKDIRWIWSAAIHRRFFAVSPVFNAVKPGINSRL